MQLYNTQSQQIECFPVNLASVTIAAAGITPQGTLPLPYAFIYTTIDCLVRYLEFQGCQINYIQNITHFADHSLPKAADADEERLALRQRWSTRFIGDMQALNIRPPDCLRPQANEQAQGEILIHCQPFADFTLHTIRMDYVWPEKTYPLYSAEEIVQNFIGRSAVHSCTSVNGKLHAVYGKLSSYYGKLYEDEKFSNSFGDPILLCNLLSRYSPDVLRFYLASHHYRRPWSFSLEMLTRAAEQVRLIEQAVWVRSGQGRRFDPTPISRHVITALHNDLNTTTSLTILLYLAEEILDAAGAGLHVKGAQSTLRALSQIFGLTLGYPAEQRVREGWSRHLPELTASEQEFTGRSAVNRERLHLT